MLMFIEIATCLALVYALGALVCSVIHEAVAQMFHLRWKSLNAALNNMLEKSDYDKLMAHPLIKDLWDASRRPTAIPSAVAARAIVHAFEDGGEGGNAEKGPIEDVNALLNTIPGALQRQIVPFLDSKAAEVGDLYRAAQNWFDTSMTAASDWYGRQAHWLSILVAVLFAIAFNIDTISIGTTLAREPVQRAALTQMAKDTLAQYKADPNAICPGQGSDAAPQELAACLDSLKVAGGDLIGWSDASWKRFQSSKFLLVLLGWLASGLAMSLGARFWFDALSHLISVRAGLAPQDVNAAEKKSAKTNPAVAAPA